MKENANGAKKVWRIFTPELTFEVLKVMERYRNGNTKAGCPVGLFPVIVV